MQHLHRHSKSDVPHRIGLAPLPRELEEWPYITRRNRGEVDTEQAYQAYRNKNAGNKPSDAVNKAALPNKIKGYFRLDKDRDMKHPNSEEKMDDNGEIVEEHAKACFYEDHPFVFAFFWATAVDDII
jgi:hypothetical protein